MKFYVTTPIYYVNDIPHIGHAYTTIAADVVSRFRRMTGFETFFLTGTDEHGQKVQKAAEAKGRSPKEHADMLVNNYKNLWTRLNVSNDAFIRTTDEEHKKVVSELLNRLWEKGEIRKDTYSGWYCTPDERFWTEKDLVEGKCPECGREVERIEESNYFFIMSKYGQRLVDHIEKNPGYILPETRRNEVLGFLKAHPLGDLCISRPLKRLPWGILLPFDPEFVTYVWFDALVNYYSATRYLAPGEGFWPADHHLIGKDILTTHSVYWSTMLMALDIPLPKNIFAHGWWTVEGKKMSKSLGNVVNPADMAEKYGVDAFRYFLLREVPFGLDGDFSEAAFMNRINTELANDFGNLHMRTFTMLKKYFGSIVPVPDGTEEEMKSIAESLLERTEKALDRLEYNKALDEIWRLVSYANKYIESNAPWVLAKKDETKGRLSTVMYSLVESLRFLALFLQPFMPEATKKLWEGLGLEGDISKVNLRAESKWGRLKPSTTMKEITALFPRIEDKPKAGEQPKTAQASPAAKAATGEKPAETVDKISIEDFMKVKLKAGRVVTAERVKGSKKLLRLEVDIGEEMRQVVAGIGSVYAPEDLLGKQIVLVANLKPTKLMGVESRGMLLAATDIEGVLSVLTPDKDLKPGAPIK